MRTDVFLGRARKIGPVGTIARAVFGSWLIYAALTEDTFLGIPEDGGLRFGISPWEVALGLVGFPLALLALQELRLRWTRTPLRATGPLGFTATVVVFAVLVSIPFTRDATLLFYGVSMLVAAARGYEGCEVLAVSNWVLDRDDQVGCVLFSPPDAAESRWAARAGFTSGGAPADAAAGPGGSVGHAVVASSADVRESASAAQPRPHVHGGALAAFCVGGALLGVAAMVVAILT